MKSKLSFFLFFYCIVLQAQTIIDIDGKQVFSLDSSFIHKDTLQKIFLKNNVTEIWNLRQEINTLNFDHCNHNEIGIIVYIDTTGTIQATQLLVGTGLTKIDSAIISAVKRTRNFKPVTFENMLVKLLVYIKFKYHNKSMEEMLAFTNGNYGLAERMVEVAGFTVTMKNVEDAEKERKQNECDKDSHFYNEGVKSYQQEDFKKAIYYFTVALEENPRDIDARYNLGLCYQKLGKMKKACECFDVGIMVGHTNSVKAHDQYCSGIADK